MTDTHCASVNITIDIDIDFEDDGEDLQEQAVNAAIDVLGLSYADDFKTSVKRLEEL